MMNKNIYAIMLVLMISSPVKGEVVEFECRNLENTQYTSSLFIDTELKLAAYNQFDVVELRFIDWRSDAISWQQRIGRVGGSASRLMFMIFQPDYRLTVTTYRFLATGPEHSTEEYLCISDLLNLRQVMRRPVE
jgi:hypothetical protein